MKPSAERNIYYLQLTRLLDPSQGLKSSVNYMLIEDFGRFHLRGYTTLITPFGRFYFNRLPFGIASAPRTFSAENANDP